MSQPARSRSVDACIAGVLVYGTFLRVRALGSDPIHPTWRGWMQDEGRWTELSREWALFGAADPDTVVSTIHFLLAPLYQILTAGVFRVWEPTFFTARLPSALAGVALLLMVFLGLRRRLQPGALLLAVALIAVHPELVYYSRVAIPEMISLLFHTAALLLLVGGAQSPVRAASAGLLTALGLLVKVTTLPVVLAFVVAILTMPSDGESVESGRLLKAYLVGLGSPALCALPFVVPFLADLTVLDALEDVLDFVQLNSPYDVLETLYAGQAAAEINYVLLALWPLLLLNILRVGKRGGWSRVLTGSLAWVSVWLVAWSTTSYFPDRWMVHIHVPLALAVGASASLAGASDRQSGTPTLRDSPSFTRWCFRYLLALPLALIAAPLLVAALDSVGLPFARLRQQVAIVLGLSAVLTVVIARVRNDALLAGLLSIPLAWAIVWRSVHAPSIGTFWSLEIAHPLASRVAILLVAAGLAFAAWHRTRRASWEFQLRHSTSAYVVALVLSWTATNHLPVVQNASEVGAQIAFATEQLEVEQAVGVARSTTFLIPTKLRYHEILNEQTPTAVLLVAFWSQGDEVLREGEIDDYDLIDAFEVPGFPRERPGSAQSVRVHFYERSRPPSSGAPPPR